MIKSMRRILFLFYTIILRLPIWAIIWLVGRTGMIKTIFVIYPHDKKEYADLCPDFKFLVRFLSGRPVPGGIILDSWKPMGIYFYISNTPQELVKKKNRHIAEAIVRRMKWIQKISGAKTCGFAGQLGPILERRHGIAMEPPFFGSTMGNIFSIEESIAFLGRNMEKKPWHLSIGVLGGGELGEMLQEHFSDLGYDADIVDVKFKRRGGVELKDAAAASQQLERMDFVINLLHTGEDFLNSGAAGFLKPSSTVIDFSRPRIAEEKLQASVFMGNRIQRSGLRFAFALPGWRQEELPACAMPSILAANYGVIEQNLTKFCSSARQFGFETALAPSMQPVTISLFARLQLLKKDLISSYRGPLFALRKMVININF